MSGLGGEWLWVIIFFVIGVVLVRVLGVSADSLSAPEGIRGGEVSPYGK